MIHSPTKLKNGSALKRRSAKHMSVTLTRTEDLHGIAELPWCPTVRLFGVDVAALSMTETVDRCRELIRSGRPTQHVVLNAAKVVAMHDDPELHRIIESCDLINADGMSIVWTSRLLRRPLPERVAGIDLFLRLVEAAGVDGFTVFLLGAEQRVVDTCKERLEARVPGVKIVGARNGFWTSDQDVIAEVRAVRPDMLFLAVPSPRKEFWLRANLEALDVPFVMGVGGSFDVVAGKTSRAPRCLQRIGMEWTWRLVQEPRRMIKRYAVGNSRFVALTYAEWRDRASRQKS